ncbi:deoxyribose-phosphate aldolase [Caproiciproducens sp. MSJ-32]|uniref:deoxyribose-phosphate aldolase n=1 Tax=Caproiciproducens sp. MSJ-32 TaxID=2841527 RepID=UPI001C105E83|nr:deoxyribose-phosphate aldolase [Caproiciproducens sp. MSJ-32]MBU5453851.1 deoxyribose-phosphate aldolase [Caproiciproducens sp. MSJ-32]
MEKILSISELANMIDHTLLKAYVNNEDFERLCREAKEYGFKMVAINPAAVEICKKHLLGTKVHVGAAIGFPLGQNTIEAKVYETKDSILKGADEIDYVINIVELKNGNLGYLEKEMRSIVEVCREKQVVSKVILENCYLTDEEKIEVCKLALKVKPDFIKTSTGFGNGGATVEDVKLMKSIVGEEVKVKAAGGIRNLQTCLKMIEAGAERIGTSSGVKIIKEYREFLKK